MFLLLAEASFRFVERPLRARLAYRSRAAGPVGVRAPEVY
jgi:peptidoglycan/LPS O-acetylase OafA/YrhL